MTRAAVLRASVPPMKRVLGAATPPRSPRGYHVLIVTRCVLGLLLASGCVSKPAYEQVSSAIEVEREAHKRTYGELERHQAKLRALEAGAEDAAPKVAVACAPSEPVRALPSQKAELDAQIQKVAVLEREKRALARTLAEKEALLRTLREREETRSAERAEKEERLPRIVEEDSARAPAEDASFSVDPMAPPPLPAQAPDADGEIL